MSGGNMGKVVLVTLCFVIAACAASPPSRPGSAGVRAPRAFIEVTAVDVPEQISGASLVNVMREADVAWGVNAFYRADALPQARFDLFVYPAGRMPAAIGARLGQDTFVGGLESMRTQEAHGRFEILGEEAFPVPVIGRPALDVFKTRLRVEINDRMHASRAYIGWRRDYFLKLRVSVPPEDEGTLDTVADAAARELFAATRIHNLGDCLRLGVHKVDVLPPGQPGVLDPVSEDGLQIVLPSSHDQSQLAAALTTSMQRLTESGCVDKLPTVASGFKRQILRFKAEDWKPGTAPSGTGP